MNDKINIRNLIFGIIVGLIVILNIFEWTNFIIKYNKQNPKVSKVKNLKNKMKPVMISLLFHKVKACPEEEGLDSNGHL